MDVRTWYDVDEALPMLDFVGERRFPERTARLAATAVCWAAVKDAEDRVHRRVCEFLTYDRPGMPTPPTHTGHQDIDELAFLCWTTCSAGVDNFFDVVRRLGEPREWDVPAPFWWHEYDEVWANALRDVVGNPFDPHPMRLPPGCGVPGQDLECVHCSRKLYGREVADVCPRPHPSWRFDRTVVAVARDAYLERLTRPCPPCKGRGTRQLRNPWGQVDVYLVKCTQCDGSGRVDIGELDPDRLKVLADAMEDAGCTDQQLMRHLRGEEWIACDLGTWRICEGCGHAFLRGPSRCPMCTSRYYRKARNYIPKRGPHYRGCWALDCVLGES